MADRPGGVAVVGAAGAFGGEIAAEAVRRGHAPIWLVDLDGSRLADLAERLAGADVRVVAADIADPATGPTLEQVWQAETPEVVVNAAGIRHVGGVLDTTDDTWDTTIDVNLKGAFVVMRAAGRAMRSSGRSGAIVTVVSVASTVGFAERAAYCAAKAGVVGLTRGAALDLAPHGIRVLAVSPGLYAAGISADTSDEARARVPLGRAGSPPDLARLVLDLARNDFLTGTNVVVDGGATTGLG